MRDWKAEIQAWLGDLRVEGRDDVIEEVAQHVEQRYRMLRAEGAAEESAYREAIQELSHPAALGSSRSTSRCPPPGTTRARATSAS